MDQIVNSKNFLTGKIKAMVAQPAEKSCAESVQPFLASILEELMGPVSSGFSEVRSLFEKEVDELSQNFQTGKDNAQLKEHLDRLMNLPLDSVKMEPCYIKVNLLQERLQDLKSRFRFPHVDLVVQRTQNYMQELMENAVFTFEQLLAPHLQGEASKTAIAIEKVKLRVLKQYDYDSSTIRKRIFQEALVQITLPTVQKALASTCKPELQKYEQFIFADHTNMIHVENVYEEILHQMLLDETLKVIKEAAILKKHNLFEDNMALPSESVSSLTDLKTPVGSSQASPARRASAILLGVADGETPSNDVFPEPEGKQQPGVPSPLAQGESLSSPDGDAQGVRSGTGDPVVDPLAAEDTAGAWGTHSSELEFAGTPADREAATLQEPQSLSASCSLKELRSLLTVTVEVPTVSATLETEKDTHPETVVPQEIDKEEEMTQTQVHTEATEAAASNQDDSEEGGVGEREACSPAAEVKAEAGASGVESGGCSGAQPACGGLSQGPSGPGPTEEQAEAGEPTGRDAHEGGKAVPQGGCILNSDPVGPRESQVSVEDAVGGKSGPAQGAAGVGAEEVKGPRVYECQWVVENAPNTDILGPQEEDAREGPPEQPSEE
ncbi:Protein Niban [Myotis davidii]|uniref:Protein Niban n=2 Tax=Myotis davidii TaxID=225400 RepID=L5LCC7_MYODS|nr:Protein Niban [Myotis davidii]